MVKNRPNLAFDNSFGSQKDYFLFALDSQLPFYQMGKNFSNLFSCQFSYLTTSTCANKFFEGQFRSMYASLNEMLDYHCIIIENETTNIIKKETPISEQDKKLPFQTLSLFEEQYFLINNNITSIYQAVVNDYNYLLLFYKNKSKNSDFINNPESLHEFDLLKSFPKINISNILFPDSKKNKDSILGLQDFICMLTIYVNESNEKRKKKILSPQTEIPSDNVITGFPPLYKFINNLNSFSQEYNSDYLKILANEIDTL